MMNVGFLTTHRNVSAPSLRWVRFEGAAGEGYLPGMVL
jgi:hypothetical protein